MPAAPAARCTAHCYAPRTAGWVERWIRDYPVGYGTWLQNGRWDGTVPTTHRYQLTPPHCTLTDAYRHTAATTPSSHCFFYQAEHHIATFTDILGWWAYTAAYGRLLPQPGWATTLLDRATHHCARTPPLPPLTAYLLPPGTPVGSHYRLPCVLPLHLHTIALPFTPRRLHPLPALPRSDAVRFCPRPHRFVSNGCSSRLHYCGTTTCTRCRAYRWRTLSTHHHRTCAFGRTCRRLDIIWTFG